MEISARLEFASIKGPALPVHSGRKGGGDGIKCPQMDPSIEGQDGKKLNFVFHKVTIWTFHLLLASYHTVHRWMITCQEN